MRNNQPVTDRQVKLKEGQLLVSTTDHQGKLTYVNKDFIDISGFTRKELIGTDHNIVRHPDMPPAAFKSLWDTVKAHRPWTGMVKNRCKNGDYYWVQANITPIREDNLVTGYMSVRTLPTAQQVTEAEELYRDINAGNAKLGPSKSIAWLKGVSIKVYIGLYSLLALTLVIGIARLAISAPGLASLAPVLGLAAFLLIGGGIWLGRTICKPIMAALKTVRQIAEGNFSDWLNTDRTDELGELLMNIISTQIRLGFAHNDLRRRTWETERVQQALNTVNTSVMIADAELNIIFMNDAVKALFTAAEEDIRSDLPNFDASTLLGSNIDQFHKNPAHQRGLLSGLSKRSPQIFHSGASLYASPPTR